MTRARVPPGAHVDDGVLLALHDHQSVESPDVVVHVGSCAECRARLARIGADSEVVRSALLAVPVPAFDTAGLRRNLGGRRGSPAATSSRWRRPAIMVAAALALATAAAASVGPIRTLIARRNAPAVVPTLPRESPVVRPTEPAGTMVSFAETGPVFTVRFDSTPAGGDLEIDRGTSPDVISAQAMTVGADSAVAMVVLPHELRLRNDGASTATYRVMIPSSVERLRVIVGGRALFDSPPRHARIALDSGRRE